MVEAAYQTRTVPAATIAACRSQVRVMTRRKGGLPPTPQVLWHPQAIRGALWALFADPSSERVAVVAFVGEGASGFIPEPQGLTLVCWDKEGCTNPDEIRTLRALGVRVLFASNVHAKLFWAAGRGTLIGSANLSKGALGDAGLLETMVSLPDTAVDVKALMERLSAREVTAAMLDDLDRRTAAFRSRNRGQLVFEGRSTRRRLTFEDWLAQPSTNRPRWTFFAFKERIDAMATKATAQMHAAGVKEAFDYWCGMPYHATPGRWMLSVDLDDLRRGICWAQCEENPVRLTAADRGLYGQQSKVFATQYYPSHTYGNAPFNCTEKAFVSALQKLLTDRRITSYRGSLALLDARTGELTPDAFRELVARYRSTERPPK